MLKIQRNIFGDKPVTGTIVDRLGGGYILVRWDDDQDTSIDQLDVISPKSYTTSEWLFYEEHEPIMSDIPFTNVQAPRIPSRRRRRY